MSQKFSIVIEVGKNGKPITTGYIKAEANLAGEHFLRLRDEGKEAYFFQHPIADRRNKSSEQVAATLGVRDENGHAVSPNMPENPVQPLSVKNTISSPTPKKRKGNDIEGVSLNIDANGPSAVDM
jgi:hypothetical protein